MSIYHIRDVRNELYHISGRAEVSDAEFVNKWAKLEAAVTQIGTLCSNDVENEMKAYVKRLKHKTLPPADPILNKLKTWYSYDANIKQIKENVIAEKKEINEMKDEVKQGNKIANAAKQIAVKNKDMLKRAMVVSSTRSDHFKRTCKRQLPEGFIPDKADEDIKTKLNEHHRVVVSGSDRSTYLASALYAIKGLNYKIDRCVQITRADDRNKVNYEDVDLVLCVDPFGCKRYNTKKANDMATIFDNALEEANDQNADTRISFVIATSAQSLKKFRHSDEHELLSEEVGIGLLSTGDTEDEWDHDITDPILKNLLAQSGLVIRQYRDDNHTLPKLQSAYEKFEENKHVVLSGPHHSGKTTMAMRLLLPHAKDMDRCLVLTNPTDWKHVNVEYIKIVVIEDFCGKFSYDREMAKQWLLTFDTILACIEEENMRVLITCCDENLQKCWYEKLCHKLLEQNIELDAVETGRILKFCGHKKGNNALGSTINKGNIREDQSVDTTSKTVQLNKTVDCDIYGHSSIDTALFTSATLINEFNVSLEDDESFCSVTGILVDGDLVYIADYSNDKVELFNTNGQNLSQVSCDDAYVIAKIDDRRIAVTKVKHGISIIATEGLTLRVVKTLDVSLLVQGITFYNDHLYVVCRDDKNDPSVVAQIEVLALDGTLKRRISPVYQGSRVLDKPNCIVINQQTGTIYVTDWIKGVISLTPDRKGEFVQQSLSRTETAEGVAIDEYGYVYVCGFSTNNVLQISPNGKYVTEILNKCRRVEQINIQRDKLFLGYQKTNIVRVFKLT